MREQGRAIALGCCKRSVLGDASAERDDVGLVRRLEPQPRELGFRACGRTRFRQIEDGPVTEPDVVGMLFKALKGGVVREQELAAALELPDAREPLSGSRQNRAL